MAILWFINMYWWWYDNIFTYLYFSSDPFDQEICMDEQFYVMAIDKKIWIRTTDERLPLWRHHNVFVKKYVIIQRMNLSEGTVAKITASHGHQVEKDRRRHKKTKRTGFKSVFWQFLCEKNSRTSRDPASRLVQIFSWELSDFRNESRSR